MPLCLFLIALAAGCASSGQRWEVRAENRLPRGQLSIQARSEGNVLKVALTLAPGPGEEAAVGNVALSRFDPSADPLAPQEELPPETIRVRGENRGVLGLSIYYSTGDVEEYLREHSDRSNYDSGWSPGLFLIDAEWTLTGPWAEAPDLTLLVDVVAASAPHGGVRRDQVRVYLIRPRSTP